MALKLIDTRTGKTYSGSGDSSLGSAPTWSSSSGKLNLVKTPGYVFSAPQVVYGDKRADRIGASAPKLQFEEPIEVGQSFEAQMSRLAELRRQAAVDLDTALVDRLDRQMQALRTSAGKQTASDRVNDILSSALSSSVGSMVNAAGVGANAVIDPARNQRNLTRLQETLDKGYTTDGQRLNDVQKETLRQSIADLQKKLEKSQSNDSIQNKLYKAADQMIADSAKFQSQAKQGLGTLGQFGVDVAIGGLQLATDIGLGAATGLGAMAPIAVRSFGGGAQEARQDGATLGQQMAYGIGSAAVEVLTEKLSSIGVVQKTAFGAPLLKDIDSMLEGVVAAIERAGKTEAGKAILNRLGSAGVGFLSEGAEEMISGLVNPLLKKATYSTEAIDWKQTWDDALYEFLVGGAIGAIGGGIGGTDTTRSVDKASAASYNKNQTTVSPAAAPQVQQVAQEEQITRAVNPESEVLSTGATLYTELGMRPNRAKEKAEIVQRLVAGEKVDVKDINKLNLTDKAYRNVFTQLTGVQFPEGRLSTEQVHNLARSAGAEALAAREAVEIQQQAQEKAFLEEAQVRVEQLEQESVAVHEQVQEAPQTGEALRLDNGGEITQEQFTKLVTNYYAEQGVTVSPQQANAMFSQLKSQGVVLQSSPEMDLILKEDNTGEVQEGDQEAAYLEAEREGSGEDVGRGGEVSGRGVRGSAEFDARGDRRDGSAGTRDDAARREMDSGEGHRETDSLRRLRGERSAENPGGGSGRSQVVGRGVRGPLEVEGSVTEAKDTRELLEQLIRDAGESGQTQAQRAEAIRGSGLRSRSKLFRELGGSQAVVAQQDYTPEMKRIASFVKRFTGAEVYFKVGALYDSRHRSYYTGVYLEGEHVILLRADHPRVGLAQVFGHEIFHCFSALDQQLPERIIQRLAERTGATVEDFNKAISKCFETPTYLKAFGGPMNDENRGLYYQEFIGDLHGGLNIRLKWDEARFNDIKTIVDDEIAAWEAEWAEKGQQNTVDTENSDSTEGRVFSLDTRPTWEEQLATMNETSSHDALYIEETPNLLAEVGLGDLPLCMTKAHMKDILHAREEGNIHYHGLPYEIALRIPELLSKPAMILKSRTRKGDVLVVTTAVDDAGDPVVIAIHPNGRATVDGVYGPANFITSCYGRSNMAAKKGQMNRYNLLYLALSERGILYWNSDRMDALAREAGLQLPRALAEGKVAPNTILGVHEGYRKSRIPQRMFSFDEEDTDINDPNLLLAPPLFSKLEEEVEKFKGEKIGASSIISYLRGKGVKAEEVKWSGIATFLEGKKSVPKQELLEFLRGNRIRVETETRSDAEVEYPYMDTDTGELYDSVDTFWAEAERRAEEMGYRAEDVRRGHTDEEGNTSFYLYRPARDGEEEVYVEDLLSVEKVQSEPQTKWGEYITGGGTNYRELLFKLPGAGYSNQAMKVHWGTEDVLAHARVQDFETPEGEKVLFVEEIQSDWHNAGAKNGYATPDAVQLQEELEHLQYKRGSRNGITFEERDRIKELQAKLYPEKVRLEEKTRALRDETGTNPALVRIAEELIRIGVSDNIHQARMQILVGGQLAFRLNNHMGEFAEARVSGEDIEALRDFTRRKANHEAELQQYRNTNHDLVPDAPFSKNYHEFVLKNLMREAAEKGYGYLAWTTGKMQEERWDSKYAEGYRIEYDQDIPKFLNKYGKQWGAKVQPVQITTDEGELSVPGIPVNDAMKQDVLHKGQPMFSFDEESEDDFYSAYDIPTPKVTGAVAPTEVKQKRGRYYDKTTGEELFLNAELSKYGGLFYRDEVGDYLELAAETEQDIDFDDLLDTDFESVKYHEFAREVAAPDRSNDSPVANMERTPTDTAEFKKWFKDPSGELSNPDGTPKILLHGSPRAGFTRFDMGRTIKSRGIYLSDSMGATKNYATRGASGGWDADASILEFKPVVLDSWQQAARFADADLGMRLTPKDNRYILSRYTDSGEWEQVATYPATAAGLDKFNAQYGKESSASDAANPGYYAVYATMSDPLVVDAQSRDWEHVAYSGKQQRFLKTDDLVTYAFEAGYDGVIIKNVLDGDSYMEEDEFGYPAAKTRPMTDYIVKSPGQVKSVYNTGTWNRRTPDMRFSFDEESPLAKFMKQLEQEYGEGSVEKMFDAFEAMEQSREAAKRAASGRLDSLGSARSGFDPYSVMQNQYGTIEPGEKPTRVVDVPASTDGKDKVSKTVRTVSEAKATPEARLKDVEDAVVGGKLSYIPISNKVAARKAHAKLKRDGWTKAYTDWAAQVRQGIVSSDLIAMGATLLNNAGNNPEASGAVYTDILVDYTNMLRTAGQAVQAARILKTLSPEAELYVVEKIVQDINGKLPKSVLGQIPDGVQIDPDLIEAYEKATTEEEKAEILDKLLQNIADQIPATRMDKWTALRYLNMLGNFKTQIRNGVGNVMFQPVRMTKDAFGTLLESLVAASGHKVERTKSFTRDPETYRRAVADFEFVKDIVMGGGKYTDSKRYAQIIEDRRRIFKSDFLEWYRVTTNKAMNKGDLVFCRFTYADALARYLRANGVNFDTATPEVLDAGREYAIRQAAEATYRDNNAFSMAISGMRFRNPNTWAKKAINTVGEGLLPFRKTPANILVRAVEYSPVGAVSTIAEAVYGKTEDGQVNGSRLIENISKNLTGTSLMALGYLLFSKGLLRGEGSDDDREEEYEDLLGHQAYSLELPNGFSLTLDWLAPESIPLFLGAQVAAASLENGLTFKEGLDALLGITDPLLKMSMLQGVNDALENASSYGEDDALVRFTGNALWSFLTQGLTNTLLGQLERASSNTRMSTYTDKNGALPGAIQRLLGQASAKIPGVEYGQIPYVDAWGRMEQNAQTEIGNVLNQLFNPAYTSQVQESQMETELRRLYQVTGEASALPSRADSYFNVDKERVDLTAEQYVTYATEKGQVSYAILSDLTASAAYQTLDDKQKLSAVEKVYSFANALAKSAATGYPCEKWDAGDAPEGAYVPDSWVFEAVTSAAEYNIPVATYVTAYAVTKNVEGLPDKSGKTVSGSVPLQKAQLIHSLGLSAAQTEKLMEDFEVGKEIRGYSKAVVDRKLANLKKK